MWRCAVWAGLLAACQAPAPKLELDRDRPGPDFVCAPGFEADGAGCRPILPAAPCPPGSMSIVGHAECVPVGPTCPSWADPDPSGWGCRERLPANDCAGATFEKLGFATCQPIGDCGRPFPPAEATIFVDDSFTSSRLDSTHFRTVSAALMAAPDNAVIAVDDGTYNESLFPTRAVRIVGRCAARVKLQNADPRAPGFQPSQGVKRAALEGFTITGHRAGVVVRGNAELSVKDCLIDSNAEFGIRFVESGGSLKLEGSRVSNTRSAPDGTLGNGVLMTAEGTLEVHTSAFIGNLVYDIAIEGQGGKISLTQSVLRATAPAPDGRFGRGLEFSFGATGVVQDSVMTNNTESNLAIGADCKVAVSGSIFRDARASTVHGGYGIEVDSAGAVTIDNSTFMENEGWGVVVSEPGSTGRLSNSVIVGPPNDAGSGAGLLAQTGASMVVDSTAIIRTRFVGFRLQSSEATVRRLLVEDVNGGDGSGPGDGEAVLAAFDATLSMTDSTLRRATVADLVVGGDGAPPSHATISRCLFSDGIPSAGDLGVGMQVTDGAQVAIDHSALMSNSAAGLSLVHDGTMTTIIDSVVSGGLSTAGVGGHGVVCIHNAGFSFTGGTLGGNQGVAVATAACAGLVDGARIVDNAVGVHAQSGTVVEETSTAAALKPMVLQITSSTHFVGNTARTGLGTITLPSSISVQH